MKRYAVLLIVMILMISGCNKPAASTTPTPSAMATPPAPTHTPTPTPKSTPAPAPTPQLSPRNTYETTGTVDGLICGLTLGMPMEEAERLLDTPGCIRDEYPFGTVEYGGPSSPGTRIMITKEGHAGPRGIEVGDDIYEAVHRFYVQEEPFEIDAPEQNTLEYDLYQTGQMSGEVEIFYESWYTYRYDAPGISLSLEVYRDRIESITITTWEPEGGTTAIVPAAKGTGEGPLTGHKRIFTDTAVSENEYLDELMPEVVFPAANTGAARYGELEGDMDFHGLALGNDLTPDAVRDALGVPLNIYRECEFGSVRYKYDGDQWFLYEIDIKTNIHPEFGDKFLYGMKSGMAPDAAIEKMYVREDGSDLLWEGFEALPADGWISVHDGPQCGLTVFGEVGQASADEIIFYEGTSYNSDDICLPDTSYEYWIYLGVDFYGSEEKVVRQAIRYLWPDHKTTAPAP